ncbi:MAG: hypothetical protein Q8Q09_10605 [Deltaproteobacteria bacterium]|nr:hypothetical protein [Deltaproteobacteria bacterium]
MARHTHIPCTQCARHVRATDPQCPFCGTAITEAQRLSVASAPSLSHRLSRSAMLAVGASLTLGACASTTSGDRDGQVTADARPDAMDEGTIGALYGDPGPAPEYGAPPPPPMDAGDSDGGPAPRYGAPPAPVAV